MTSRSMSAVGGRATTATGSGWVGGTTSACVRGTIMSTGSMHGYIAVDNLHIKRI